jgi:histidinol phosphatase-like enzyme
MLLNTACEKHQIDPKKSVFFGDSWVDQIASDTMGIRFIQVGADGIEYTDDRPSTSRALKEFTLK